MTSLQDNLAQLQTDARRAMLAQLLREKAARLETAPLSFAQQPLWFLDQLEPNSCVYNLPLALRLSGPLQTSALKRALQEIVNRHEVLRTTFAAEKESPMQVIADDLTMDVPTIEVRAPVGSSLEAEVKRLVQQSIREPFDLARGPLIRARLLRLSQREHVLVITLHHIVCDSWSLTVLLREMSACYETFLRDTPSPLADLPVQYADFAVWQRQQMRGAALEKQLAYWTRQIENIPNLIELPADRPRPAKQTYQGEHLSFALSAARTRELELLSQRHSATLFMTVLAILTALLHRYTGQGDVAVGTPIANRTRPEIEPLIGFFANTLVLRTPVRGDLTFQELLGRVRQVALEAYDHQDLPFEKLVEKLHPERTLSHNPIFQVMLVFQNALTDSLALPGLTVTPLEVHTGTAKFDLTFAFRESSEGLLGEVEYNTDIFEAQTIRRLLGHLQTLIEGIVAQPHCRLAELPFLTEAERHQLLEEWNSNRIESRPGATLHELFEAQAERTPQAVAVVCESEPLTYGELNRRANRLAHLLRERGVGPETRVGICLERSLDLMVGLLAILKAGGAYVPMDLSYPADRVAFILEDTQAPLLLTQTSLLSRLPKHQAQVICVDEFQASRHPPDTDKNLRSGVQAENLAYVIYTSGSTGWPKGVLVTHHNVVRLFQATENWFHFNPKDVWTFFHSHAFDFSVWEIWGALLYGGKLAVVPYLLSRSPEEFDAWLRRERVTVLNQTPSAFRQLDQARSSSGRPGSDESEPPQIGSSGETNVAAKSDPMSLRLVIFGGEALELPSLKPWFDQHGDQHPQLVNMFGITETTVHVTYRPVTRSDLSSGSVIGVPIPDLQVYVLDKYLRLVPVGVPGELYVGGAGLGRGYLHRPDLTAERFIPHPFSQEPGARLYKTGDLARWLENQDLEYLGRIDDQIKIRGFRVEPGEIESILAGHPGVREVMVLAREESPGDKRLVAYLVPRNLAPTANDLREFLREKLPEYMIPSAFVVLEDFPLTTNGKIDRRALSAMEVTQGKGVPSGGGPRTATERVLAEMWGAVLGREAVGVEENFFDLGGHSLLITRVMARVRAAFELEVPLRILFEAPTIASLGAAIDKMLLEEVEKVSGDRIR